MYLSVGLARHDSQATTTSVVFAHALDANRERGRRARRSWASPSRDTSKSRARLSKSSIKMQTQENARSQSERRRGRRSFRRRGGGRGERPARRGVGGSSTRCHHRPNAALALGSALTDARGVRRVVGCASGGDGEDGGGGGTTTHEAGTRIRALVRSYDSNESRSARGRRDCVGAAQEWNDVVHEYR